MKYFEIHDPYYALIKAPSKDEGVNKYIEVVSGNENERKELSNGISEIDRDAALVKFTIGCIQYPQKDGMSYIDIINDFTQEESEILLIDGSLL